MNVCLCPRGHACACAYVCIVQVCARMHLCVSTRVCVLSGRSGKHSLSLTLISHTRPVLVGSWSKTSVFLGFSSQPHSHPLLSPCPPRPLLSPPLQVNVAMPLEGSPEHGTAGPGAAWLPNQQDTNLEEAVCYLSTQILELKAGADLPAL